MRFAKIGVVVSVVTIFLTILYLLLSISSAQAAEIRHVAMGGVDAGDCLAAPCATLDYTIQQASAGDTILIADGIYTEAGITVDKSLLIQGESREGTIIQGDVTSHTAPDRVFEVTGEITAVIETMTIRYGLAGSFARGGGIWINDYSTVTTVTLNNLVVSENGAYNGGGIANDGGVTIVNNTVVTGNFTTGNSGAGLLNDNQGLLTINSSTVSNNWTTGEDRVGGGVGTAGENSVTVLNNSTVSNNRATGHSGGIHNGVYVLSTTIINNSTIVGNTADSDNDGSGNGGGVNNFNGTVSLYNTILANNIDMGGEAPDCAAVITSQDHNLIEVDLGCDVVGSTGNDLSGDPALSPLADHGGPTLTHALLPGSPAVDAADNQSCPETDQRGAIRPQGAACDIGAYEHVGLTAVADEANTMANAPILIDVLSNDQPGDISNLSIAALNEPLLGSAVLSGTMVFYAPALHFSGVEAFSYRATDGLATSGTIVTVTVTPSDKDQILYLPLVRAP